MEMLRKIVSTGKHMIDYTKLFGKFKSSGSSDNIMTCVIFFQEGFELEKY